MAGTPSYDSLVDQEYDPRLYAPVSELAPLPNLDAIGPECAEQYHTLGFLSVAQAFPPSLVQDVKDALLHFIVAGPPEGMELQFESAAREKLETVPAKERQDYVRKFMWFVRFDPRFEAMAYHPPLLAAVERMLGAEAEMFQEMALFKPPGIGREKPWHQDHAYFNLPEGTPVVGVWIALDDATLENGCMVFQPGGHRQGPIPHFQRRDWQICDAEILKGGATVAAPIPAGGCLIFDGLTPHGTPSNRSGLRRRAVQFHYVPKGTPRTATEERMRIFGTEGKNVSC